MPFYLCACIFDLFKSFEKVFFFSPLFRLWLLIITGSYLANILIYWFSKIHRLPKDIYVTAKIVQQFVKPKGVRIQWRGRQICVACIYNQLTQNCKNIIPVDFRGTHLIIPFQLQDNIINYSCVFKVNVRLKSGLCSLWGHSFGKKSLIKSILFILQFFSFNNCQYFNYNHN